MSCLEPHPGFYRLSMKIIFDAYVLWPFGKKFIFELVTLAKTRNSTVCIILVEENIAFHSEGHCNDWILLLRKADPEITWI